MLNDAEQKIMKIFLKDWHSISEASRIYSPYLPKTARNHRTVTYYFYKWKEKGWIEEAYIQKERKRKRFGKVEKYLDRVKRYKLTFDFYFDLKNHNPKSNKSKEFRNFVKEFLNQSIIRDYILKNKSNIMQTIDKLLFLMVRMSMEYYYNEMITDYFPSGIPWEDEPQKMVESISKFPKKDRFPAMLWAYAFICVKEFDTASVKLMSNFNPLLSEYDQINAFWYRASKGKYFQKLS